MIAVYFAHENSAENPELIINGEEDSVPIYKCFGKAAGNTSVESWDAGSIIIFFYTEGTGGSNPGWIMANWNLPSDSYGSSTQPIYWNAGVPTAITSYGGNSATATAADLTTTQNAIAYYNDTHGTFADSGIVIIPDSKHIGGWINGGQKSGTTLGSYVTAEGYDTTASGNYTHAEGCTTVASNYCAHAEGSYTTASGYASHAEGESTNATNDYAHAEGYATTAGSRFTHAEGLSTTANGWCGHAEGDHTTASTYAHAEGYYTTASGDCSSAIGDNTTASGTGSHSEGYHTTASGNYSHAEGYYTTAEAAVQHVFGQYNKPDTGHGNDSASRGSYVEIVGNGVDSSSKSNARTLDWNGNERLAGSLLPMANNFQTLGNTTYKWQKLYIGTADSYGSSTQPIYWNAGVPTAITSYGGNAATATKLATARTINGTSFDGSANITTSNWGTARTITIGSTGKSVNGSANVSWSLSEIGAAASSHTHLDEDIGWSTKGYKNVTGGSGIIDVGFNGQLRANRFFGIKNGVTVQYSTNGGSTWTTYPSANIAGLFTTGGGLRIVPSGTTCDANSRLRITIDTGSARVYTDIRKFMFYVSTNYSQGCTVTIDAATHNAPTNFSNIICTNQAIAGWSGWNVINTGGLTTYGNQGYHYQMLRFTFANTGMTGSSPTSHGLTVSIMQAYGGIGWTTPSTMALTDHLYNIDTSLNATFPANLTASKVYGAVWNDYAEYRQSEVLEPGRCVREVGDDTLVLTDNRLQPGCEIVSDTFGFAIGETDNCKTPIASSGRVLAYPYEDREEFRKHIGEPVCSGPNGTVSIMTPEEEKDYPSRIIGTISAVPDYETWGTGNVEVKDRVWIRIR